MNCPVCHDSRMKEVEKNGVLIDVCPSCKGVWLDRGELDKLMREVREVRDDFNRWYYDDEDKRRSPGYPPHGYDSHGYDSHDYGSHDDRHRYEGGYGHKHKRKKSVMDLFGDLFD